MMAAFNLVEVVAEHRAKILIGGDDLSGHGELDHGLCFGSTCMCDFLVMLASKLKERVDFVLADIGLAPLATNSSERSYSAIRAIVRV